MSQFETNCPHCGTALTMQEEWIGMEVECPECKKGFVLQTSGKEDPAMKTCPFCGNEIKFKALRCKFCKSNLPQTEDKSKPGKKTDAPNAVSFLKKRCNIVLSILLIVCLLLAVGIPLVNNSVLYLAIADGNRLLADPDVLMKEKEIRTSIDKLNEIIATRMFIFGQKRTEDLIRQLKTTKKIIAAINNGRNLLFPNAITSEESFRAAIGQLKDAVPLDPQLSARYRAEDLIQQLKNAKQNLRIPSREAIRRLNVNDTAASPQITIRKTINPGNDCTLWVLPTDRKAEVEKIYRKMCLIGSSFSEYKKHLSDARQLNNRAKNVNITGIDSYNTSSDYSSQALDHVKKAKQALVRAKESHDEVKAWLMREALQSMNDLSQRKINRKTVNLSSNSCTLSNIRGPILLLTWETINFGDGFSSFQGWYKEYNSSAAETWILK